MSHNILNIGIIGINQGNGHPYSFSAIINGYKKKYMARSGWENIYAYLEARDPSDFGINTENFSARISHIWTQDIKESKKIAKATNIEYICKDINEMIETVDAIIIARDDWECHKTLSKPFLERGKYVFIDKPLSLSANDLTYFAPFIENGKLHSYSSVRYALELDSLKRDIGDFGDLKIIRGTTVKSWDRYAIHLLDGIFSVIDFEVLAVEYLKTKHESFIIHTSQCPIFIDALGQSMPLIRIEFYSDKSYYLANITNSFMAFKRSLIHFLTDITQEKPMSSITSKLMNILISGNLSRKSGKKLEINK